MPTLKTINTWKVAHLKTDVLVKEYIVHVEPIETFALKWLLASFSMSVNCTKEFSFVFKTGQIYPETI